MNDTELDRLLNSWDAPAPPSSMRDRLRARFPRTERIHLGRPLKWGLATLCAAAALTVAAAQTGEHHGDIVMHMVDHVYGLVVFTVDQHRAPSIRNEIRRSQPTVYIDGNLAGPLEYRGGATLVVHAPGDSGVYMVSFVRFIDRYYRNKNSPDWMEAGSVHGNVIEFQAGDEKVRIECNRSIIDGERPVFVAHLPE